MHRWNSVLVTCLIGTIGGCAGLGGGYAGFAPDQSPPTLAPSLLFDVVSGETFAWNVAPRGAWPTTANRDVVRESIAIRERFEDRQGWNTSPENSFLRRVTTLRIATSER